MTTPTKTIMAPGLPDLMAAHRDEIFSAMNCVKIGVITKVNSATRTAEIQLQFKRVRGDKIESYPLLVDCPIFTLQGGGGAVYLPVQAGDPCLVLFADRNIDIWYSTGAEAAPANQRCHDLSDGIALVGINTAADPLAGLATGEAGLVNGAARFALKGGKANIQNATKDLLSSLTKLIEGIQTAQCAAPGSPLVDTSTKIAGAQTDLNALLYKD